MVAKYEEKKCLVILQLNHCQNKVMYNITVAVACYVRAKLVAKTYRSTTYEGKNH